MQFLLDTNILITGEPGRARDLEAGAEAVMALARAASGVHRLLLHPTIAEEIENDGDDERRQLRQILRQRYPQLQDPPAVQAAVTDELGTPQPRSHDWYDHLLLACVLGDAVHGLVTQDVRIHRKAHRIGVGGRVHFVADAVAMLERFTARAAVFVPSVEDLPLHALDLTDPFFDSLRADYAAFNPWFRESARAGRRGLVIYGEGGQVAALCIIKGEDHAIGRGVHPGKISTFKVADAFRGNRYGELLLKALFGATATVHDLVWLTVFERHTGLIALLRTFGFEHVADAPTSERIYAKRFVASADERATMDPLDYHRTFGPPSILVEPNRVFLVPIRPEFHVTLFPDAPGQQLSLVEPQPHGNALRKAYLCRTQTRSAREGDTLLFYRSSDEKALTAVGVLESTLVSDNVAELQQYVGTRTVYSTEQVRDMAARGPVLAMLFRQDRFLAPARSIRELQHHGVVRGSPQTVVHVRPEGIPWVQQLLSA